MVRVDRADCPTVQADDARDALRTGRVAVVPVDECRGSDGRTPLYRVELEGDPLGIVLRREDGWIAARPGWVDTTPRTKRHAAVRRVLMSHPRSILGL